MSETTETTVTAPTRQGYGVRWPLVLLLAGGAGAAIYGYDRYATGIEHRALQASPLPSLQDTRPLIEPPPAPPRRTIAPPPDAPARIVEPPKVELPKAEAPRAEPPKVEAPKVETVPGAPPIVAAPVEPPAQLPVEKPKDTASPPTPAPEAPRIAAPEVKPEAAPTLVPKTAEPAAKADLPKPAVEQAAPATPVVPAAPTVTDSVKDAVPAVATPKAPALTPKAGEATRKPADPAVTVKLLERGKTLLTDGNIAGARLFLERAAETGHAEAALLLGSTFDPAWLATAGAHGTRPEPAKARRWYTEAQRLGSKDAADRLTKLGPGN